MSTRCNIIIKDQWGQQLIFYRHSDGYPQGVAKTLGEFLNLVKNRKIRDNVEQSAGWLILLGYEEYSNPHKYRPNDLTRMRAQAPNDDFWKVGAYEPSCGIHKDIEYLYEIDLESKTLRGWSHDGSNKVAEITEELLLEVNKHNQ